MFMEKTPERLEKSLAKRAHHSSATPRCKARFRRAPGSGRRPSVPIRNRLDPNMRAALARHLLCSSSDGRSMFRIGASQASLKDRRAMKHKNSHLLVGYWSRLRKGRDVPDQTDIDPRQIKRLLSYTFILDCENPSRPVYRLAGTALCERFGFELKGTGFLAHWESQSGLSLASLLQQSLKVRQPVCLSSIAATADNGMVELETILAPISLNGGAPTRFIGMVQMLSDPAPLL